jgi:hypothetical protein
MLCGTLAINACNRAQATEVELTKIRAELDSHLAWAKERNDILKELSTDFKTTQKEVQEMRWRVTAMARKILGEN